MSLVVLPEAVKNLKANPDMFKTETKVCPECGMTFEVGRGCHSKWDQHIKKHK